MNLAEQIRASRRLEIKVGEAVYFARRPTFEEFGTWLRDKLTDPEIARRYVTGWQNVRAKDLFQDGADDLIEFDQEVWNEAVGDMPDTWKAVVDRIVTATNDYHKSAQANSKNLRAGSNLKRSVKS